MIHKNWAELIKPQQLEVKPGNDPQRQATLVAEPLERGFGLTLGNALRRVLMSSWQGAAITSVQTLNTSAGSNMVFDWEMGDGSAYLNTTDVLHNYSSTGTFDIQLVVSDSLGCVPNDTMVVQVVFLPAPLLGAAFSAAQVPDCNQSTVDCVNQTTGPAPSFQWDMGDGTTYTTTDVTGHVYAAPGQYTISLIPTDTLACPATDMFEKNSVSSF